MSLNAEQTQFLTNYLKDCTQNDKKTDWNTFATYLARFYNGRPINDLELRRIIYNGVFVFRSDMNEVNRQTYLRSVYKKISFYYTSPQTNTPEWHPPPRQLVNPYMLPGSHEHFQKWLQSGGIQHAPPPVTGDPWGNDSWMAYHRYLRSPAFSTTPFIFH